MSDCKMTQWDELYRSLRRERDEKLSYQLGQVNINNLTSHLDELYDKIDKLESRLNELEPSMNDVSGPTGLIGDHPMTNEQYSPATQAVSDAIKAESLLYEPLYPWDVERIAAAALRAAADEVYSLLNVPASTTEPEMVTSMRTAYAQYHRFLHKIAQELGETK